MKASIAKHVEYSRIDIKLPDEFKLEGINDDVIVGMVDNMTKRLQVTVGEICSYFVIIHRVSDNRIYKSMIDKYNRTND